MKLHLEALEARDVPAAPFMIAVLPDTQIYTQSFPATFDAQTQWIVDNRVSENIVFVTHEGDIVQNAETGSNNNLTQWSRADSSIDILDGNLQNNSNGLIPYSVAIGNHDFGEVGNKSAGNARYLEFFGPDRYEGRSWYGGSSPDGLNHYQIFQAGDWKFMNIAMEWEPGAADISWAQAVIAAHPGLPTMITTHSYLNDSTHERTDTTQTPGAYSGEEMFQALVSPYSQVFMVLNGHFSGEFHRTVTNAAGLSVFEMVTDYQSRTDGGEGFMPLLTFDPTANQIRVRTYSPLLDEFETDSNSQFTFNVNFNARFGAPPPYDPAAPSVQLNEFRQGENGYSGTVDTNLKQASPTTSYGSSTSDLLSDAASTSTTNAGHVLLRFNNIIGSGVGQVPAGATILSAELVLDTNNSGDGGALHRMLKTWSGSDTWNSLSAGIQADGVEVRTTFTAQAGVASRSPNVPEGPTVVNVTSDVQAWANGSANHGWAFLPWADGSDGWGISPSEAAVVADRPLLRVEWAMTSGTSISSFQEGISSYSGTSDTALAMNDASTRQDAKVTVTVDGPTDGTTRHGLLKFDDLFGPTSGRIPAGANVLWARLYITTPSGVTNAEGAGAQFYRMKKHWDGTATWAGSFGGNGIQADGVEARTTADFNTGAQTIGAEGFDVTDALRAWAAGEANHGWGLLFNSSDAWIFGSSEQEAILNRPRLVVAWSINQAPTNLSLSSSSIAENQLSGTPVGTFASVDPNSGETFTYSLVSGTGSTNNSSFTIVGNQLRTAASFNYEQQNSYAVRVRTTDSGNVTFEKALTIAVTDLPAPTVTAVTVNNGDAQRSRTTTIKVAFSTLVNTSLLTSSGAFKLQQVNGNFPTYTLVSGSGILLSTATVNGHTEATLFFNSGVAGVEFGSLADGTWTLTIDKNKVQSSANNEAMAANVTDDGITRLYGDIDGDGVVDINDLTPFGSAFGSAVGDDNFLPAFDIDASGTIDINDLTEFGGRFGLSL